MREIFPVFLKLGSTSFGGPVAHLGYFRRELVERRRWLGEEAYAQVLALCQFLPGPASSQVGFSLGLLRGGFPGAIVAFLGFTLPSALLMVAFAIFLPQITEGAWASVVHGLKLVALAVVAHGVQGMARRLCADVPRATIAVLAGAAVLAWEPSWVQLVAVGGGALLGAAICRTAPRAERVRLETRHGRRLAGVLLAVFLVLLAAALLVPADGPGDLASASAFYRAGALVFGGGHVVLPLLEETVVEPGLISQDDFLAGYGAAQAVPGPMFSLASYLGARIDLDRALVGALAATAGIFLPGFLLVAGMLPWWGAVVSRPGAARAVAGVNAAVVGLLAAALYDPIWKSAVRGPGDVAVAAVALGLLLSGRVPTIGVVFFCVLGGLALG